MSLSRLFIISVLVTLSIFCYAQKIDSTFKNVESIPNKYYSKVGDKLSLADKHLTKKSLKYLHKLEQQENKLQQKFQLLNPEASADLFGSTKEKYSQLTEELKSKKTKLNKLAEGQYNAYLDTLSTSLSFLKQFKSISDKAKVPLNSLKQLQGKLLQSEKIKQYVSDRKERIREVLSQYTKVPAGLKKQFAKLNKTAYYYSAQVKEYKEMLKDPVKAERKALSMLNKLPAFQKFMKKNSQLASMFRLPDSSPDGGGQEGVLAGLQTRASVQTLIQQQVGAGGPNAQQIIQQNLTQAHNELNILKDKASKFGGGSNIEMPDFKPNSQKTKSFLKRLEFGTNIQFEKSNKVFPSSSNIGLSIGYKVNDKSIVGVGMSYKIGMGTLRHIVISHQGIGLRSFVDYKLKGLLFMSGGLEMNYNAQFKNIDQLKKFNDWQSSGLVGLSRKYSVSKKVKGEMKLLYDFLANEHKPVTQPIVFRIGYSMK